MYCFVLLLVLLVLAKSYGDNPFGIIVRGTPAKISSYPYYAFLAYRNKKLRCGGSIIKTNVVLTAAHCLLDKNIHVYTGIQYLEDLYEREPYRVKELISFPKYKRQVVYDIGLVILTSHIQLGPTVNVIPVAPISPRIGSRVSVVGFGRIQCKTGEQNGKFSCVGDTSRILRSAVLKVERNRFRTMRTRSEHQNTCEGDSGSPVVYMNKVVGIVSSGQYANCSGYDEQVVVAPYYRWIKDYLNMY
ncbi:hypothetical protein Trydic_g20583 [Trypoxylus dichotomus]